PTPTPSPSGTPNALSTTEPIAPGAFNLFPVFDGYGGAIEFPSGSMPANDPVTLTTQIAQPPSYPTAIPTSYPGYGSVPVAPWLTFQLSQPLSVPPGSQLFVAACAPSSPAGTYYLALFDITQQNMFITSISTNAPQPCGSDRSLRIARLLKRARTFANPVISTDQFYIGSFYQHP
ncbi:MAG: hypothetical protein ABI346_04735, partial [Candidatus Baltobacteraceae bacterium]